MAFFVINTIVSPEKAFFINEKALVNFMSKSGLIF